MIYHKHVSERLRNILTLADGRNDSSNGGGLGVGRFTSWGLGIEEETDRREGKGHRCCLGDEIHSIPCCTTNLAPE